VVILGIESSCDETSAAIVIDGELRSCIISSQFVHTEFGGVVPELASRAHLKAIIPIIEQALCDAHIGITDLTHCAATQGPGLIGSLLVGLNTAKAIAVGLAIPFLPIHHIEAHLFSTFLQTPHPAFPFIGLVVSGGHTLLIHVQSLNEYRVIGGTIDDAAGEAFDKVAKMLGLGFPGGPAIEKAAQSGNEDRIRFPRPLLASGDFNFSFSGIKTSVLYYLRSQLKNEQPLTDELRNDISAGFQKAVVEVLVEKTLRAAKEFQVREIALAGGVSANRSLQEALITGSLKSNTRVFIPDKMFSTDNAAMIAMLAYLKFRSGVEGNLYASAFARVSDTFSNA
jgi:N6-L-threonylcarbamoyladenine synthase